MYKQTEDEDPFHKYKPQIIPGITVGADLRTMWIGNDSSKYNTVLQMQGDISFSFEPTDFFSIYLQQGLSGVSQVFAKTNFSFLKSYIKVGKFRPDYGWWQDDHTAYTRAPLRWRERYTDTGVEFGLHPERWFATAAIFNGTGNAQTDENSQKAYSLSLRYRPKIGRLKLAIGGSYYSSVEPQWAFSGKQGITTILGPHFSIAVNRFVLLGETDWKQEKVKSEKQTSFYSTLALHYTVKQGVTPIITYDFIDPDRDKRSGSNARYGIGVQMFPTPFMEIYPMIRMMESTDRSGSKSTSMNGILMLHFFY